MLQWHNLKNSELSIAGQRFTDQNRVMMAQMEAVQFQYILPDKNK